MEKLFGPFSAALVFLAVGLTIGAGIGAMLFTSTITLTRTSSRVFTETRTLTTTLPTTIVTTQTATAPVTETQVTAKTLTLTLWKTETRTLESWKTQTLGCESGYLITSYWTVKEEFYRGEKIPVKDSSGRLLGYYRRDFVEDVMIEGWGKGDGVKNDGTYLGYDPEFGFIADEEVSEKVVHMLLNSEFVVSDRSPSITGRHIDIYVGEQDRPDMNESPYALYVKNATICLLL